MYNRTNCIENHEEITKSSVSAVMRAVGLVLFLCSMKDSTAACALCYAWLMAAKTQYGLCVGNQATLGGFFGMVTVLKWCPLRSPSRVPPTRWSLLCLVTVATLKTGLPAPPSGALYLMT